MSLAGSLRAIAATLGGAVSQFRRVFATALVALLATGLSPVSAEAFTGSHPASAIGSPLLPDREIRDIKLYAKWVLEDISDLDEYVQDGISVAPAMRNLAKSFQSLADAAVPPKAKPSAYKARAQTLADFASLAAEDYETDNEVQGLARYVVIRKQTGALLAMINKGLKTKFRLPAVSGTGGSSGSSSSSLSSADVSALNRYAARIVEDITELDKRVTDGIAVSSRLDLLASSYQALASGPVPPGSDSAGFRSRAQTLADFAGLAASEYAAGSSMAGRARYEVLRRNTPELLNMINTGVGANYALP